MTLKLITRNEKLSQETIDILRSYLERAERGELVAVAVCAIEQTGSAVHQASASDNQLIMLGAVSRLMHRMQLNADELTQLVRE